EERMRGGPDFYLSDAEGIEPTSLQTLSPLGRGWFASAASKPGEGLNWFIETPHPTSRFREMSASPQRGEAGAGWFDVIAFLTVSPAAARRPGRDGRRASAPDRFRPWL